MRRHFMKCSRCGYDNPTDTEVCSECGEVLNPGSAQSTDSQQNNFEGQVPPNYAQPDNAQPNYAQTNYVQPTYGQTNYYAQPNYTQPYYAQPPAASPQYDAYGRLLAPVVSVGQYFKMMAIGLLPIIPVLGFIAWLIILINKLKNPMTSASLKNYIKYIFIISGIIIGIYVIAIIVAFWMGFTSHFNG
jgi:hypothetical protein